MVIKVSFLSDFSQRSIKQHRKQLFILQSLIMQQIALPYQKKNKKINEKFQTAFEKRQAEEFRKFAKAHLINHLCEAAR